MITLPEKFKESIINRHHEEGIKWLNNIDRLIKKYIDKYELEDIRLANKLSINLVFFAKSRQYGDVVLKIAPGTTLISEVSAIKHYLPKYSVICYDYDEKDKVMLLELLSPGISLFNLDIFNLSIVSFISLEFCFNSKDFLFACFKFSLFFSICFFI